MTKSPKSRKLRLALAWASLIVGVLTLYTTYLHFVSGDMVMMVLTCLLAVVFFELFVKWQIDGK